ncbi:CLUMA_CG014058, isoform A [Clunio marinus]|uniref:Glutaredoxin-2, mitochondrial n=1 Tax=Clunio marinus TaxID=568069 RepID=A0A1J1INY9_9DIPT|nr:CLUMA_CG014058, isoform A [Clunio marinus]
MGSLLSSSNSGNIDPMAQQFVRETIESDRVVIFSKSYCPYCTTAKKQFKKLNQDYLTIELDGRPDCQAIQNVLGEMTGAKTVPRVFIDGNFIGGGDDCKRLYENGQLEKMLA